MSELTKSMCWELVVIKQDKLNEVGAAIFRKPTSNDCYDGRAENEPPICKEADDPDAAWYSSVKHCILISDIHLSQTSIKKYKKAVKGAL